MGELAGEFSERDSLTLLRISEQVDEIAARLNKYGLPPFQTSHSAEDFKTDLNCLKSFLFGQSRTDNVPPARSCRPPLPDPRLVRRIIRSRQLRSRYFEGVWFADAAWDILLDLTAARAEHKRVSVTSLCIASGVPPTTALRWISMMTNDGLLVRIEDDTDRRRAFVTLSDSAANAMARYFLELGADAAFTV